MNTENNKIIAEFMGKKELITEEQFLAMEHKAHNPTIVEYLKYDTDWNWLMEVVEKIESFDYTIDITSSTVYINHSDDEFKQIWGFSATYCKKEAVYNACLEFIKWYNKQIK